MPDWWKVTVFVVFARFASIESANAQTIDCCSIWMACLCFWKINFCEPLVDRALQQSSSQTFCGGFLHVVIAVNVVALETLACVFRQPRIWTHLWGAAMCCAASGGMHCNVHTKSEISIRNILMQKCSIILNKNNLWWKNQVPLDKINFWWMKIISQIKTPKSSFCFFLSVPEISRQSLVFTPFRRQPINAWGWPQCSADLEFDWASHSQLVKTTNCYGVVPVQSLRAVETVGVCLSQSCYQIMRRKLRHHSISC